MPGAPGVLVRVESGLSVSGYSFICLAAQNSALSRGVNVSSPDAVRLIKCYHLENHVGTGPGVRSMFQRAVWGGRSTPGARIHEQALRPCDHVGHHPCRI